MDVAARISERLAGRDVLVVGRAGMDIYPVPDGTRIEDAESSGHGCWRIVRQHCRDNRQAAGRRASDGGLFG